MNITLTIHQSGNLRALSLNRRTWIAEIFCSGQWHRVGTGLYSSPVKAIAAAWRTRAQAAV